MKISESTEALGRIQQASHEVKTSISSTKSAEKESDVAQLSSQARQTLSIGEQDVAQPAKQVEVRPSIDRLKEMILERVFREAAVKSLRAGLPVLASRVDETATIEVAAQRAEGRGPKEG